MKRTLWILTFLLCLQVVAAFTLAAHKKDTGVFSSSEPLLGIRADQVRVITIEQQDKAVLKLQKENGSWVLPEYYSFPVAQSKIRPFLQKMTALKKGWAVATTQSAAKRFKVSDTLFERKITFEGDGKQLSTLLIGSSPGFRKVHARVAGDSNICAIPFSAYEAGTKPQDWIDTAVLHIERADIERLEMPDFSLKRVDDSFVLEQDSDNATTDQKACTELLSQFANLRIQDILGTEIKPEYRQDAPELRCAVWTKAGDRIGYAFSKPEDADYFVLKTTKRAEYFKVMNYTVERLKKFTRAKIIPAKTTQQAKAAGQASKKVPIDNPEPAAQQSVNRDN